MKTIFVDAIHTFVLEDGMIFHDMYELLEKYPNKKIILTSANDEQFKVFKLATMPYDVFTLKHDPEKTDKRYYEMLLEKYNLEPGDCVYFEHSPEAVETAKAVGIECYFYDSEKKDIEDLKNFLDTNL
jgi:HAD superfamily hydrolase (TIGR01509 family)